MGKKKLDEYCVTFGILGIAGLPAHVVVKAENSVRARTEGNKEAERRGWDTKVLEFRCAEKTS
jgi:hypothetical protein